MKIPTQIELFGIVLRLMDDGENYTYESMARKVLTFLQLPDIEHMHKADGLDLVFESRVAWAMSCLEKAHLATRVKQSTYTINDEGRRVLAENLDANAMWITLSNKMKTHNP